MQHPPTPLISVMVPCYNSASTLRLALMSLLLQTHQNWEALVVDDGSTDNPEVVIAELNDQRIRFFSLGVHLGRSQARQKALDEMRGEFLTMLDADDWILPDKLACQLSFLQEHPEVGLVSTSMYLVDASKSFVGVLRQFQHKSEQIYRKLTRPGPLPLAHAPILVRSALIKNGKYDFDLNYSEDLDFFLPVLMKCSFAVLSQPYYVYAFAGNRSAAVIKSQLAAHKKIFAKYSSEYPVSARVRILLSQLKSWLVPLLDLPILKMTERLRRFSPPSADEKLHYDAAWLRISTFSAKRRRAPTAA